MDVPASVSAALQRLVGRRAAAWRPVSGGCSPAGRARAELEDGARVFVKWAVDDATAGGLRAEWRVYDSLAGNFLPRVHGFCGDSCVLVLEDLSDAHWPPPWREGQPRRALDALRRVHRSRAPEGLVSAESCREFLTGWRVVAADPAPLLALGLASEAWLRASLPALLAAEDAAVLDGDALLHFDARGDNLCQAEDGRVVFLDWNWACVGNGAVDLVSLAVSVHADGGPAPEALLDGDPAVVALLAGFWASRAGLPPPPRSHSVRELQQHCLGAALPWAARLLELPPLR